MFEHNQPRDPSSFQKFEKIAEKNIGVELACPIKLKRSDSLIKVIALAKYDVFLFKERSDSALLLRSIFFSIQYLGFVGCLFVFFSNSFNLESSLLNIKNFLRDDTFKAFTTFLGSCSIVYWNLSSKFGSQWKYCADLYNKIFIDGLGSDDKFETLYKKINLAIDLLATDMWHHRSFSKLFADALESSLQFAYENNKEQIFGSLDTSKFTYEGAVSLIKKGSVDVRTASAVLSNLQTDLEITFVRSNT